ncbi:hypothetical protein PENARI_c028G05078 [Penicillium arizonense]|uniref:Uncharacterized protein n=1 Tax=Penicillium arizonense TaxID=1835702 RepID=A0A1F5L5D4_PENAI|nr:hypothetical protein PENARI_c028G05078 [Penicillium arizonense]OGE48433.1 hypothetical protein PENARI_c028G05078 [Penicillium arizonense]
MSVSIFPTLTVGAGTVRAGSSGDATAAVIEDRQTIGDRISLTVIAILEISTQCVATAFGSLDIQIAVYKTLASVRWNREGSNGDKNKIEEPHIGR